MPARAFLPLVVALSAVSAPAAQAGDAKDRPGTQQTPPSGYAIPPAPPLDPSAALAAFVAAPGLQVELAAAEPTVVAPVCMQFDGDGRLWVVEMPGYMPDVDGHGEREANGSVAVLEDEDGDGVFEKRTTFLDGLVLPRAVCVLRNAALVIAPPRLLLCPDRDGDLRADASIELFADMGGLDSPEHAPNGLLWALDNRIYLAKHAACYVWDGQVLRREPSPALGQWGISQDDAGRLFYNDNSTHLRVDLLPRQLVMANPHQGRLAGLDHVPCRDQTVWPVRVTPGVNRGYQPGVLREGRLSAFTAACSPFVYRGDLLSDYRGDVFVAEPAANLVRCDVLESGAGAVQARPKVAGREVLASLDERFRPVALAEGPDGALYVADMARGLIQHRLFVTTFLRRQVEERGLEAPLDRGRIWRVVPAGGRVARRPRMSAASIGELVDALAHPSGAWRDLAQRELVWRGDVRALAALDRSVRAAAWPAAAHALWTAHALGGLERGALLATLFASDPRLRGVAYQVAAEALGHGGRTLLDSALLRRADDEDDVEAARVLALVLGRIDLPAMPRAVEALVARFPDDGLLAQAVVAGAAGRELVILAGVADPRLATLAAAAVTRRRDADELLALLRQVSTRSAESGHFDALLAGLLAGVPRQKKEVRRSALARDVRVRVAAAQVRLRLGDAQREAWAALEPAFEPPVDVAPARSLTEAELQALARGQIVFAICAGCHGTGGEGTGEGPPFVGSEWLGGPAETLVRIVMHGLEGAIEVDGQAWNRTMPKVALAEDDIAAVLTYVRHTFAGAEPVAVDLVRATASATAGRDRPFTPPELK
ncbi:MAG: c-type cytochrome [Planctomycetota bacterium]